ncbi:MAG: helix-turn-helix domain-containing protein [Actinomycetota bacterium]|nr:helix-turn-helix domain-containing protein [Actinomycetota bacterium]
MLDEEQCYRAALSKDPRFDGWFVGGVTSTGIYCRPSCPVVTPRQENIRWFPTAAAAQAAGFRACKRCRPDAAPGSPEWNLRADLVGRAMRLIADGLVDREGVAGLARCLGYSQRHVHRQLVDEVGAGPLALARAQRAQTARLLVETTSLPMADVAFAAGFRSIRQFNSTIREVFALTPTQLRLRAHRTSVTGVAAGVVTLRLAYRHPLDLTGLFTFLAARAVAGLEEGGNDWYRRSLALPHGASVVTLRAAADATAGWVRCDVQLEDLRDLSVAVQRCRRLLDLDADPQAVDAQLSTAGYLGPLLADRPGLRVPGHPDPQELTVRAVLGQQVSIKAARTHTARLVSRYGRRLDVPIGTVTHLFPEPAALAAADPTDFAMPRARRTAVLALSTALASGTVALDPGVDRSDAESALLTLPGVGPWTASYVRMRGLGDPDVFLPADLGVRHALDRLGVPSDPRSAAELAGGWAPWRSYALQHLWASLAPPSELAKEHAA